MRQHPFRLGDTQTVRVLAPYVTVEFVAEAETPEAVNKIAERQIGFGAFLGTLAASLAITIGLAIAATPSR